ncbi:MAG: 3-dehydroquinate synthase [Lachnospiraceae bacterium]|nr:3-dehydroquinate synthase [Lachnospiraceae bacterium]
MIKEINVAFKTDRNKPYNIFINDNFSDLKDKIDELFPDTKVKACIITDTNVSKLYLEEVKEVLKDSFIEIHEYVFEAGEESKNLDVVEGAYEGLTLNHFNRKDILIALGGGVVGDLTGFTAATYMRGISFIQIPTTLLSQVDSSIGGKTGVDFKQYKNMVGAFKMPELVYINTSVLNSLPDDQFASGMAEVLKAGLLKDGAFYEWTINNFLEINEKETEAISEMIERAVNIKRIVVEKDPYELGDRALLNLGHTAGHAIEKYMNFKMSHGECVALGTIVAAFISWKREMISMEDFYEIRDMFVPFNLPISLDEIDSDEIVKLTKSDKKAENGLIKFILLKKIGKAVIVKDVTDKEIKEAVDSLVVEWD